MTDWAKDVAAKHFPTKTQASIDTEQANATARRAVLDRDSERRWLKFRTAIDNSIKDLNETNGRRLLISTSPKADEIKVEKPDGTTVVEGEYQAATHQVTFTTPGKVSSLIYKLTIRPVNGVDAVVLLNHNGTLVSDDEGEAQRLLTQFLDGAMQGI